jgi:hypothetical protein
MTTAAWTAVGTIALAAVTFAALAYTIVMTTRERRQSAADRTEAAIRLKEERDAGDRRLREERDYAEAVRRQDRQAADEAWRKALHHECWLNINLDKELQADGLWSFDTRVLRDCTAHAAAFPEAVLQRIIWARTANEQLEAALSHLRNDVAPLVSDLASWKLAVKEHRHRVIGEISAIEVELRA